MILQQSLDNLNSNCEIVWTKIHFARNKSIFFSSSSTHFFPLWMVDANLIFILLVFISSYFRSVWHPFGCFILRMVYLILSYFIYFVLLSLHIFIMFIPHCKYFFCLSSCTRNLSHKSQCCKYTLTELHAPTMHVHTPITANAFWGPK